MQTLEDLPTSLVAPTSAAVAWLNAEEGTTFELTGIVEDKYQVDEQQPFELGLVLCDGEICAARRIAFTPAHPGFRDSGFTFSEAAEIEPEVPPLLDPPAGLRSNWIDEQLAKFEFVLLLYYRGRW